MPLHALFKGDTPVLDYYAGTDREDGRWRIRERPQGMMSESNIVGETKTARFRWPVERMKDDHAAKRVYLSRSN